MWQLRVMPSRIIHLRCLIVPKIDIKHMQTVKRMEIDDFMQVLQGIAVKSWNAKRIAIDSRSDYPRCQTQQGYMREEGLQELADYRLCADAKNGHDRRGLGARESIAGSSRRSLVPLSVHLPTSQVGLVPRKKRDTSRTTSDA